MLKSLRETALNRHRQGVVLRPWFGLLVVLFTGRVLAQDAPAPAVAASTSNARARGAPAAPAAADADLAARVEELSRRLAEQDEELTRQRTELDTYKSRLDDGTSATKAQASSAGDPALEALLAESGGAEGEPQAFEPQLRVYGFADVGLQRAWGGLFQSGLSLSNATNFVLGNVNIYFDATPFKNWRFLTEVRFTNFPDGTESSALTSGNFARANTGVFDYTSPTGGFVTVRWAGIVLERAHVDWTPSDAFNIRSGYFLTPYGVWNVDHGSPTRIMLRPPFFVSLEYFPERRTRRPFPMQFGASKGQPRTTRRARRCSPTEHRAWRALKRSRTTSWTAPPTCRWTSAPCVYAPSSSLIAWCTRRANGW